MDTSLTEPIMSTSLTGPMVLYALIGVALIARGILMLLSKDKGEV